MQTDSLWLFVKKSDIQKCRKLLNSAGIYDKSRKILTPGDDGTAQIPILGQHPLDIDQLGCEIACEVGLQEANTVTAVRKNCNNRLDNLKRKVEEDPELFEFMNDLPETYELYNDLLLLPSRCFQKLQPSDKLLNMICDNFRGDIKTFSF